MERPAALELRDHSVNVTLNKGRESRFYDDISSCLLVLVKGDLLAR
jgi:hypothetical protein